MTGHATMARKTGEFLVEKLSELEVAFLLHSRQKTESELDRVQQEHSRIKSAADKGSGDIEAEEEAIRDLRVQLQDKERTYEHLQSKKLDLLRENDCHENNLSLCTQRIADIENSRSNHLRQIDVITEQIHNRQREITEHETELTRHRHETIRLTDGRGRSLTPALFLGHRTTSRICSITSACVS